MFGHPLADRWNDLRYALRPQTRNWGFTILAVGSLGPARRLIQRVRDVFAAAWG